MKKMILKVSVGMILGLGALAMTQRAAMADPVCEPTFPPAWSYGCEGQGDAIDCSDPLDQTVSSGGCYDTNGNCVSERFELLTETVSCTLRNPDRTTYEGYCTRQRYEATGTLCLFA